MDKYFFTYLSSYLIDEAKELREKGEFTAANVVLAIASAINKALRDPFAS